MSFLLDTDICSAHLKSSLTHKFIQHMGRLHVSVITVGELYTWALRGKASPRRLQSLRELLNDLQIVEVTEPIAHKFGEIRAKLLDRGTPAPDMDLLIAATALTHDLTLVIHNVHDFAAVPELTTDDWLA